MDKIDVSVNKVIEFLTKMNISYEEITQRTPYYNMAATLTDAVLQAGMNYHNVVYPRVLNILKEYADYRTTCEFIILFQTVPIEEIIKWKNKKKQKTIYDLAWFLYDRQINTEDDLAKWLVYDENIEKLLTINGIGYKTVDYLKLLSGQQAIPIDRHMFQFLNLAGVLTKDYKEASLILKEVARCIDIKESVLDKSIWTYMSEKENGNQITLFEM